MGDNKGGNIFKIFRFKDGPKVRNEFSAISSILIGQLKSCSESHLESEFFVPFGEEGSATFGGKLLLALTTTVVDVTLGPFACSSSDLSPFELGIFGEAIVGG